MLGVDERRNAAIALRVGHHMEREGRLARGFRQDGEAPKIDPRRQAALDTALQQVEKSFGKGSAMRLGDRPEQDVEVIPTGSLALDMALGIGAGSSDAPADPRDCHPCRLRSRPSAQAPPRSR